MAFTTTLGLALFSLIPQFFLHSRTRSALFCSALPANLFNLQISWLGISVFFLFCPSAPYRFLPFFDRSPARSFPPGPCYESAWRSAHPRFLFFLIECVQELLPFPFPLSFPQSDLFLVNPTPSNTVQLMRHILIPCFCVFANKTPCMPNSPHSFFVIFFPQASFSMGNLWFRPPPLSLHCGMNLLPFSLFDCSFFSQVSFGRLT